LKGGRLPSLMRPILNRKLPVFVILLSLLALAGCSADPRVEANRAVERANEEIAAHDRLFDEARATYSEARQSIRESNEDQSNGNPDSGDTDSGSTEDSESTDSESTAISEAADDVSEARSTLQEARSRLENAREEISGIQDLDVSGELLEYSRTLEDALSAQMRAEEREISFYEILADDPGLEDNRERAIGILAEAEDAYAEAESGYEEARSIAGSNPDLITPEGGSTGG